MTNDHWDAMSLLQKIAAIIEASDEARMAFQAGYPSQWVIENGKVYWATIDHDDAPELIILPLEEFIDEYEEIITDLLDK